MKKKKSKFILIDIFKNFDGRITQPYNKYKYLIISIFCFYTVVYIKHNFLKPEFEARKQPNILIPVGLYDIRRQHYVYWEISRVARGLRKTFSYYNYDKESKLLYFVDRKGNNLIEKILFNEERPDLLENPFLEFLMKKKPWNDLQLEKANLISAYYLNINNRYDLDNYLHYKAINGFDFLRWFYFHIKIKTGIADIFRNEQFLKKNDLLYNYDLLLVSANLNSGDKKKVKENFYLLLTCFFCYLCLNIKSNNE